MSVCEGSELYLIILKFGFFLWIWVNDEPNGVVRGKVVCHMADMSSATWPTNQ